MGNRKPLYPGHPGHPGHPARFSDYAEERHITNSPIRSHAIDRKPK